MLLYNKAFDPVHTLLRLAAICNFSVSAEAEVERLQIFDFLLAFPAHIADMPLSRELLQEKNKFKKYKSPYNNFEPYTLFNRMSPIFFASLQMAESIGFMDFDGESIVKLNKSAIPEALKSIVTGDNGSISKEALSFEVTHLAKMPILGKAGLKAASKLMDFKYDYPQANH
ncbi:ABC-three component system middle component 5 [Pseudomonas hunanensis]|uniref:ABC-three component system middle component 5 n=1 Tax=Pseudomonas hunanensis TaxID=1247546 RepID=UPI0015BAFDA3|nr:ABC-three component system middle component 5 [Pseudomonas hunanensis]NWL05919.1 hypothetical protein [Pseudomonas hunanensis]